MKLKQYLDDNDMSHKEFYRKIGIRGKSSVQRWASGEVIPNIYHMRMIEEATDGAVKAQDFYDE